jgi:hypothetical protein
MYEALRGEKMFYTGLERRTSIFYRVDAEDARDAASGSVGTSGHQVGDRNRVYEVGSRSQPF